MHAGLSAISGGLGDLSRAKAIADALQGGYFSGFAFFDKFMIEIVVGNLTGNQYHRISRSDLFGAGEQAAGYDFAL